VIPVEQSVFHDPANGRHGDCMRAMIASIFELPLQSVPHFFEDGCDAHTFNSRVNAWLRPMNMAYLPIGPIAPHILEHIGVHGLHHEASGPAARGVLHACVALDGTVVHDPHPSKAGLLEIEMAGVFVVLDPSKPAGVSGEPESKEKAS
jgi:hypothetical protein